MSCYHWSLVRFGSTNSCTGDRFRTFNSLIILSGAIWRQLTAASWQTVRTPLRSADCSLLAHALRPHQKTWLNWDQDGDKTWNAFISEWGPGHQGMEIEMDLVASRDIRWDTGQVIGPQITWSDPGLSLVDPQKLFQIFWRKFVSKILEEICFTDFGGKLFQRFWRKIVSKILEEISFKDFGGNLFQRFLRKCIRNPGYRRHRISRPMRILAPLPISF